MGYKVSGLSRVPVVPGIDLYIFLLGQRIWDGSLMATIENNFSKLAEALGPDAAVVAGHDGVDLTREFVELALSNSEFGRLTEFGEATGGAILILGAHPQEWTDQDIVLYAPLLRLEELFGSIDIFLEELCRFSRERRPEFLERFQDKENVLDLLNDVVELKPNFFGFGLNINEAISRFRERKSS